MSSNFRATLLASMTPTQDRIKSIYRPQAWPNASSVLARTQDTVKFYERHIRDLEPSLFMTANEFKAEYSNLLAKKSPLTVALLKDSQTVPEIFGKNSVVKGLNGTFVALGDPLKTNVFRLAWKPEKYFYKITSIEPCVIIHLKDVGGKWHAEVHPKAFFKAFWDRLPSRLEGGMPLHFDSYCQTDGTPIPAREMITWSGSTTLFELLINLLEEKRPSWLTTPFDYIQILPTMGLLLGMVELRTLLKATLKRVEDEHQRFSSLISRGTALTDPSLAPFHCECVLLDIQSEELLKLKRVFNIRVAKNYGVGNMLRPYFKTKDRLLDAVDKIQRKVDMCKDCLGLHPSSEPVLNQFTAKLSLLRGSSAPTIPDPFSIRNTMNFVNTFLWKEIQRDGISSPQSSSTSSSSPTSSGLNNSRTSPHGNGSSRIIHGAAQVANSPAQAGVSGRSTSPQLPTRYGRGRGNRFTH